MSLPRHEFNAADQNVLDQLKLITHNQIKHNPDAAIWNLEFIIRNFNPENHASVEKTVIAIEQKIFDIKVQHPEEARNLIIRGMLLEKLNKNYEALNEYRLVRKDFPQCWHAYLYPAGILQNQHRYEASLNLLNKMEFQVKDTSIYHRPSIKILNQLGALMENAEDKLIEARRLDEEKASRAMAEQKRLAEAEKKRQAVELKKFRAAEAQQQRRESEEEKRQPTYNLYSVLADEQQKKIFYQTNGLPNNYAHLARQQGMFRRSDKSTHECVQNSDNANRYRKKF